MDSLHINVTFFIACISWFVGIIGVYISLHNRVTRLEAKFEEDRAHLNRISNQLNQTNDLIQTVLIKLENKQNRTS